MNCIGTYDGTIFYNPANKFCIVSVKTADQSVPAEARSNRRYKDHLIRFTAVGYEIPRTDAVELELDGEWTKGKYGVQLQVEQWREIVPRTKNGVEGYLASGLIKGIGPKTAADSCKPKTCRRHCGAVRCGHTGYSGTPAGAAVGDPGYYGK